MKTPPRQRVGQLDAYVLDDGLFSTLKTQLVDSFDLLGRSLRDKYESELMLLLKLALFKLTIWDSSTTYGGQLQNLKLVDSRTKLPISKMKKLLYGLAIVGGSYLWEKINDKLTRDAYSGDYSDNTFGDDSISGGGDGLDSPRQRQRPQLITTDFLRNLVDNLTTVGTSLGLLNYLVFLYNGRYLNTLLRVLNIELAPQTRLTKREVNYEFQNRQLVWNALTEFLLFALPLVNLMKLKNRVVRYINSSKPGSSSSSNGENENALAFLPERTCAICYTNTAAISTANSTHTDVTNPYMGECGHIYCYVCIKTKLSEDDNGFDCLRCSFLIKSAKPYRELKPGTTKKATKNTNSNTLTSSAGSSSYSEVESAIQSQSILSDQQENQDEEVEDSYSNASDDDSDSSAEFIVENY